MKKKSMLNHRSIIKASLFILILMIAWQLQAEEFYHNSNITSNETWCIPDTHYVCSNISVVSGVTLTILSHDVYLQNNLTINGVLDANGAIIKGTGGGLILNNVSEECYAGNVTFNSCGVTIDNCTIDLVPVFENCNFIGSGFYITNNSNPDIINCTFDGGHTTITNSSNPLILGCTGGTIGVRYGSSPTITSCTFSNSGVGARVFNSGSPTFTGCSFNSNTSYGVLINNAVNCSFENCNFNSNDTYGVKVESINNGTATVTFSNCVADSNGSSGIYVTGIYPVSTTIADSHIRHNGGGGIYSIGDLVITDTVILDNDGDGIYATGNVTLSYAEIVGNHGCGLNLPGANTIFTVIEESGIITSDSVAVRAHPNIVRQIPAESILYMTSNNPDGVYVIGGEITQNATWLKRDNHYTILGDIIVKDTATLQLPTNSYLIFYNNAGIEINGAILADSVNFEPVLYESWKGISFKNNIPGSVLNACYILNAGYPFDPSFAENAGIIIYEGDVDSTVTMTNCNITNSYGHGIYINRGASPYIDNCTIDGCSGNGIYISWSSNPIITNSTITSGDSCGIYINYSSNPYIDNCVISDNENYGVFTNQGSNGGTLKNGIIRDNCGPSVRLPTEMVRDISTINIYGNQNNHQIEISGGHMNIDAVWHNNYDYILYGSPFLGEGALTLEAGTVLKFEPDTDMDIRTSLTAIGTPSEHIVFTSNQPTPAPGDWEYLYFDYCAEPSQLEYCDILYGGSRNYGSVVLWEHTANFDHCNISYSSSAGMCFWSDATAYITNSEIHHNAEMGVESNPWNSVVHISDTAIHNNGDYAIQTGADEVQYLTGVINIYDNETDAIKVLGDDVITGTWQYHNVPYDIEGDITVLNSETLTIEAGTPICFLGEYSITVNGALLAEGTEVSHIVFTKSPEFLTFWKNIFFCSTDDICKLTYCDFSYGGYNASGMLEFDSVVNLQMSHCLVENSATHGLYITYNSSVPLADCNIITNLGSGIFHHNNASSELTNCNIVGNGEDGISFFDCTHSELINCVITDNQECGIYIDDEGIPTFGNSLDGWNDIYDNVLYDFYNGDSDIDVKYINWGTIDTTEINAKILDKNDQIFLGLVNYSPWINAAHDTLYYSSYGSISGTVILADGAGNITEVEVTAGGMTVNPGTNGDYIINGLPPITYDVQASLINYADSTVTDVIVVGNQNTPDIDFTLYSAAPEADFSATPTYGNQPLEVQFTDLSINGPASWLWDFGDGNTSAAQNPIHEFVDWGTFTVSLTATNDNGSDTEIKVDYITVNGQPVANAGPDQTVNELTPVQLDGSGSYDPEGEILTYSWTTPPEIQLSDSTAMQPTFTAPYVTDSTEFSIELIVYDGECYSDPSTVIITVLDIIGIDEKPIPENYTLFGSYPNPFKGSAEIEFGLPQHAFVEIKIYDIRGRLVTSLADEYFDAGNHTLTWDAGKQKSGIYFYKMSVDGKPYETKKMILMK